MITKKKTLTILYKFSKHCTFTVYENQHILTKVTYKYKYAHLSMLSKSLVAYKLNTHYVQGNILEIIK